MNNHISYLFILLVFILYRFMTFSLENKLAPLTGEIRELREREKESNYFLICLLPE